MDEKKYLSLQFTTGREITERVDGFQGRIVLDTSDPKPTILVYPDDDPKTIPFLIMFNTVKVEVENAA